MTQLKPFFLWAEKICNGMPNMAAVSPSAAVPAKHTTYNSENAARSRSHVIDRISYVEQPGTSLRSNGRHVPRR